MLALSIRQPWAFLIVRPDLVTPGQRAAAQKARQLKDIENRTWSTMNRGGLLIHAAKGMTPAEYATVANNRRLLDLAGLGKLPPAEQLLKGGIIGQVDLMDCRQVTGSPWHAEGQWGFVLANPRPLPFRPYRGMLSFFDVPEQAAIDDGGLF